MAQASQKSCNSLAGSCTDGHHFRGVLKRISEENL